MHAAPKLGFHLNVACPADYHADLHDLAAPGRQGKSP
jgi:ornithine carbamoyltransferase